MRGTTLAPPARAEPPEEDARSGLLIGGAVGYTVGAEVDGPPAR